MQHLAPEGVGQQDGRVLAHRARVFKALRPPQQPARVHRGLLHGEAEAEADDGGLPLPYAAAQPPMGQHNTRSAPGSPLRKSLMLCRTARARPRYRGAQETHPLMWQRRTILYLAGVSQTWRPALSASSTLEDAVGTT